jgi:hypothetical protein
MPYTIDPAGFPPRHAVLMGPNGTEVGVAVINDVPTTAAGAYIAGDVIGTKLTFASAILANGGASIVQAVTINSKVALTAAVDLVLFNSNPASTFTDNQALSLDAADFDKVVGVVHITDWTNLGTPSVAQAHNLALPFTSDSTNLRGVLVARAGLSLSSASDLKVSVRLFRQ